PTNIANGSMTSAKNVFLALRHNDERTGVDLRDTTYAFTTTGPIAFVAPPPSQTVLHGRQATFRAMVDGDGPYTYQWNKNGSAISGARSWKYITPPATSSDNGAQYTVTVTSPNNSITSVPGTLTVTPDALAVVSAGSVDGCVVGVKFNQPLDP